MQVTVASPDAAVPLYDTAKLYRDYSAKVSRWAARLTRSASDADDIVQEVFLTVHRRLPSLDHVHSPGADAIRQKVGPETPLPLEMQTLMPIISSHSGGVLTPPARPPRSTQPTTTDGVWSYG